MNARKASESDGALLMQAYLDSEAARRAKRRAQGNLPDANWLRALRHWIATRDPRRRPNS